MTNEDKITLRAGLLSQLENGTSAEQCSALLSLVFGDDYEDSVPLVLARISATDPDLRGLAILCLGHLARIHGRVPEATYEIIHQALSDPNEFVRGQAMTAQDDVAHFARIGVSADDRTGHGE